jgi:hypothetical protein
MHHPASSDAPADQEGFSGKTGISPAAGWFRAQGLSLPNQREKGMKKDWLRGGLIKKFNDLPKPSVLN